jgi:CelD/BcsL family acetyltransferase involved in cellulose biosynthesis
MKSLLRIRAWSEEDFAAAREPWEALLARANADSLFMSWDWQWRWWQHHRAMLGGELKVLALHAQDGSLVGIAPFYLHPATHRGLVRVRRLQLLGGAWRDEGPAFSEYLDLIAAPEAAAQVVEALGQWLASGTFWDELVLPHVRQDSLAGRLAREQVAKLALVREVDPVVAHHIPLPGDFSAYAAGLASGVRRRLLHQRAKVSTLRFELSDEASLKADLELMRRFKAARWAGREPSRAFLEFHLDFAGAMAKLGRLRLSRLVCGERPLSILYDVRVGETEYYLESGFDPESPRGLTPGYLHFGHAIEAACRDGLRRFDMLAGAGRHREYKRDLCTAEVRLSCYQALRAPLLRILYGLHALAGRVRGGARRASPASARFCRPRLSRARENIAECTVVSASSGGVFGVPCESCC